MTRKEKAIGVTGKQQVSETEGTLLLRQRG
jgi:hypothetical protein